MGLRRLVCEFLTEFAWKSDEVTLPFANEVKRTQPRRFAFAEPVETAPHEFLGVFDLTISAANRVLSNNGHGSRIHFWIAIIAVEDGNDSRSVLASTLRSQLS
ncbi:hypothetical protein [Planctomicrobium piriforme]|uniref:hypothetical protein n=1 Tax=Planctomicrobium piriforme TaxID=1576369 RepID=UPI000B83F5F2|nr:hypothetical protein [Planctomicrobium piriforme]